MTFAVPLSRKVSAAAIPAGGEAMRIEATPAEQAAIAAAYGLPAVHAFQADLRLQPEGTSGVRVRGMITAGIERLCVVSLEVFPVALREPFTLSFAPVLPAKSKLSDLDEMEVELDADDPPEPIENGMIDVGASICEFFAMALDPYPRKPGVAFQSPETDAKSGNPFSVLAKLKRD
jgi:uncharacterized metal-binding protein YceD (DUF177 family)